MVAVAELRVGSERRAASAASAPIVWGIERHRKRNGGVYADNRRR
jgi:hypothetical protein